MLSREDLKDAINCDTINCFDCRLLNKRPCLTTITQTALELMDQVEAQRKEIELIEDQNYIYTETIKKAKEAIELAKLVAEDDIKNCPSYVYCEKCTTSYDCDAYKILTACNTALEAIGGGQ